MTIDSNKQDRGTGKINTLFCSVFMPLSLNSFCHSFAATRDPNYVNIQWTVVHTGHLAPTTTMRIVRSLKNACTRHTRDRNTFLLGLLGKFEPRGLLFDLLLRLLGTNLRLFLIFFLLPFFLRLVFRLA